MILTAAILLVTFLPIAAAYVVGVILLRRLFHTLDGRDVLARFRPSARHVHHTERILRVHRLTSLGRRHD